MQFPSSVLAIAAISIGSAFAQTDGSVAVHVVSVSNMAGSLTFTPSKLVAAAGSMVQFQFAPKNHSVVQSSFDAPCQPIQNTAAAVNGTIPPGLFSGYMPVLASAANIPTYTIMINNTKPIWVYCSQAKHCQAGMSMVINENTAANASRSLENYQAAAKNVGATTAPSTGVSNGTDGTIPSSETGSAGGSAAGSATGSAVTAKATGAAASVRVGQGLGAAVGLTAMAFALL